MSICTPDKDLAQCVRGTRVVQMNRRTRVRSDEAGVVAKFGVPPASIPDYLALVGDAADGYPGLAGWGAKSAAAVLAKFGHLEAIPGDWREWRVNAASAGSLAQTLGANGTASCCSERWRRCAPISHCLTMSTSCDGGRKAGVRGAGGAPGCGRHGEEEESRAGMMDPVKVGFIASAVLYAIACSLPALEFKNSAGPNDVMFGLRALAVGWSGIFAGVVAWYADPFWLAGLGLGYYSQTWLAVFCGIVAIAISCSTFSVVGRELPGDEGNVTKTTVIRLLPGCYVWMASLVALAVAGLLPRRS